MISLDFSGIDLKLKQEEGKTYVFDPVRKRWLILTPEEHVRQYIIGYLVNKLSYPASLLSVEKKIMVGAVAKRFDIIVYNRDHQPWMLVECKAPEVTITEQALHQLLNYQRTMQCSYWVLANGHQLFCADARNVNDIKWIDKLPAYDS